MTFSFLYVLCTLAQMPPHSFALHFMLKKRPLYRRSFISPLVKYAIAHTKFDIIRRIIDSYFDSLASSSRHNSAIILIPNGFRA